MRIPMVGLRSFFDLPIRGPVCTAGRVLGFQFACGLWILGLQASSLRASEERSEPRDLGPLVERIRAKIGVPALGGAVVRSEGLVALGVGGIREQGSASEVTPEDRFHLGSCTKSMTATLAAILVEEKQIGWGSTLGETFPDFDLSEAWSRVTLGQLLAHTAGVTNNLSAYAPLGLEISAKDEPVDRLRIQLLRGVSEKPPLSEPGTAFAYSNNGYLIAVAMIEKVTGSSWEELIRKRLFEPLGMKSAGFGPPCSPDRLDHPRAHNALGEPRPGMDNPPVYGPAGTVHATMEDWARYVRLHLRGARGDEGLLLKPESFKILHTPAPGTQNTYGLGWFVTTRPWSKGPVLMHNGTNTAWFCWVWIAPEEDFAVFAACNQGGSKGHQAVDGTSWALIQGVTRGGKTSEPEGRSEGR